MFRRRSSSANSTPRLLPLCPNLVATTFPTNFIVTSKYNLITFLPIALLYQFKRYANIYFLLIAIIQSIPILSPLSPLSSWSPLVFVLAVSLIREALEDISRHRSDREMNSNRCKILLPASSSQLPPSCVLPLPPSSSRIQLVAISSQPSSAPPLSFPFPPSSSSPPFIPPPNLSPLLPFSSAPPPSSIRSSFFDSIEWGKLKVGDWVYLIDGEAVPADLIIVACSADNGICFIETASLDGEKNLKVRNCVKETSMLIDAENPSFLEGEIWAQIPNSSLGQFEGSIKIPSHSSKLFLTIKHLLLRGSVLKNTHWILGIVVYTGLDTKLMKNADSSKNKQSRIEKKLNFFLFFILTFEILFCLTSAILCGIWSSDNLDSHWYLSRELSSQVEGVLTFFTYFILNSTMIPISLVVTLELVKLAQCYFLIVDEGMFSKLRGKYAKVSTTTINEELGQVEYIFTDKTGTLTCNSMELKFFAIGTELYGDLANQPLFPQNSLPPTRSFQEGVSPSKETYQEWFKERFNKNEEDEKLVKEQFNDSQLKSILQGLNDFDLIETFTPGGDRSTRLTKQSEVVREFMMAVTCCHECVYEVNEKKEVKYQGPSPDEIALVTSAKDMGFKFCGMTKNIINLEISSSPAQRELLHLFEFNADRKRMSVIIKEQQVERENGRENEDWRREEESRRSKEEEERKEETRMKKERGGGGEKKEDGMKRKEGKESREEGEEKTKENGVKRDEGEGKREERKQQGVKEDGRKTRGEAGRKVIKMYVKGADNMIIQRLDQREKQVFLEKIQYRLDEFAKMGFRTLMVAYKEIGEKEYEEFETKLNALANVENREERIFELAETIEKDLHLLGATVVEDKLQDQVPAVLSDFLLAKIKVWMLTGDKLETAENIARSCTLIQPHFATIKLKQNDSVEACKDQLIEAYGIAKLSQDIQKPKGLLVEGETLALIFKNDILTDMFVDIVEICETVICCRVTPKQKAEVVKLVKDILGKVTLSIGDGSNDVNMIQEAHIGVGLFGNEGMRAVQAADFALGEFKYLWRLVLVHGRWFYIRISEMILYFFYKNMVFTVIQFYFGFLCAYSGQSVYEDTYIVCFNLIFTSLPLIIRAVFEKDIYYMIRLNKYERNLKEMILVREEPILKKLYPRFYYIGQQNRLFTAKRYFSWVIQGVIHALIIFGSCALTYRYGVLNNSGRSHDLWLYSINVYTCVIMIVDIKLCVYTQSWNTLFVITLLFTSLFLYIAFMWISSEISFISVYETSFAIFTCPSFYFLVFLCTGIVFGFDAVIVFIQQNYKKGISEKVKLLVKRKDFESIKKMTEMSESKRE